MSHTDFNSDDWTKGEGWGHDKGNVLDTFDPLKCGQELEGYRLDFTMGKDTEGTFDSISVKTGVTKAVIIAWFKNLRNRTLNLLPGTRNRRYNKIHLVEGKKYRVQFDCSSNLKTYKNLKVRMVRDKK